MFSPQPLKSINLPFDHSDFLFENKYDGFRALAVIEGARCRLVSRNGNEFKTFAFLASSIGSSIRRSAVLDGEVVCLDEQGHPRFDDLLFHRLEPCFVAFDILSLDGRDLRWNALVERKAELHRLLSKAINSRILYADHIERDGCRLFELICLRDLEGIVGKLKHGHYTSDLDDSTWIKVQNRGYSQAKERAEFFERGGSPFSPSIRAGIRVR